MNSRISVILFLAGILALTAAVFLPASSYHPVTPAMLTSANAKSGSRVPATVLEGSDDRIRSIAEIATDRLTIFLAGFTDVRLQPHDERRLLEYGCGITAVVCRPTRRADEVSPEEFKAARIGFEAKMRSYAPRSIAFLGKRALSAMLGLPKVEWGQFPTGFAGTKAWILPNPSGLNRVFTLDALVEAYSELRRQL